jgi:hypothetical protein
MLNKHLFNVLFIGAVLFLSIVYSYHRELFKRPHAIHTWRQCDGAQMALNYYQEDMNFFEPRLSLCVGNDGKMGSEFPIVYYAAACLYKIFGFHEGFIRLISICFFYTGLFFLFKTISLFLDDRFYGVVISLMFFTSPLVIDYAFNFLPDVPAISLTFIAYYYVLGYFKNRTSNSLWIATFFFAFAGLLKVTALIGYFGIIGVMALQLLFALAKANMSSVTVPKKAFIGLLILPVLITALWVSYIKHYNIANNNTYFLTTTRPYWNMTSGAIAEVWDWLHHRWMHAITYRGFLYCIPFLFLLAFTLITRKTFRPLLWLLIVTVQCVAYFILFFAQFKVHDYYLLPFIIIPVMLITLLLFQLKERNSSLLSSVFSKSVIFLVLLAMVVYGRRVNTKRDYHDGWSYCDAFYYIEPELVSHGIKKEDKIISIGDGSSGISLYFMNRRGWTSMTLTHPIAVSDIKDCLAKGSKYIALNTQVEGTMAEEAKQKYLNNEVLFINGIKFYKLTQDKQ